MEVDCPPGPRVVVPSNAPPLGGIRGGARVCTESGCGALIEYDSAVGSRCDRCTIRRKARDFCAMRGGALNGVGMPLGNGVPVRECVFVRREKDVFLIFPGTKTVQEYRERLGE